jgi:hypothetical protein
MSEDGLLQRGGYRRRHEEKQMNEADLSMLHEGEGGNGQHIALARAFCAIVVRNKGAAEADLDRIRVALDKNELTLFADVRSICPVVSMLSFDI